MPSQVPLEIFAIYFSPYSAHAIEIDGVLFPTVEHAYQCSRYDESNKDIREEVRQARSPMRAWEVSSKYKHLSVPGFADNKLQLMKKLLRMKTDQHADVRKALIDSGDSEIVKHITTYPPGDGFWDDGDDGTGENHMGKLWMEIRQELREEMKDEK
jgi:ribA/ribD-fused uncharacterized protein